MKEKKIGRVIILVAFVIIICLSKVIWFFSEKYLDTENYENRQMATRPSLNLDDYATFTADYTSYFNDNLQFRNYLISLNSGIDYFCFGKSSNSSVVVGKDHWLFYIDTITNYQGTDACSEEELAAIAYNCVRQRDYLREQGKEFVIFIAPNKSRIYPEYMPDRYGEPAEVYSALQIYDYLKENTDVRVVYPYAELMDAKEHLKENVYQKTDTHWNYIGGYVGASALLSELGIQMPKVYSDEITIVDNGESSGDLAAQLNLNKQLEFADKSYTVEGYPLHNVTVVDDNLYGIWTFQADDADDREIFVIRDSYGFHMADYIGSQFSKSYFSHKDYYAYDDLKMCNPDIVVYETVERSAKERLGGFSIE